MINKTMIKKLFLAAAICLIVDAVLSLIIFKGQPMLCQAGRAVRLTIGVSFLVYGVIYVR